MLVAAACGAHAEVASFSFESSLTQDAFGLSQLGAPVSGRYSFDPSALDDIADPETGSYTSIGPGFGFSAVVDGTSYAIAGMLNIGIQAGSPGAYLVTAVATNLTLELILRDDTGGAVSSDALPRHAPDLARFDVREFRLFAPDAEFVATLQQLQGGVASVPEPGSAALLVLGIAATVASRGRLLRAGA